jgi:hypothetical protein
MKTLTKVATLALILGTSTLFASSNDYALTDNYRLLNDMNLAKKQQEIIVDMSKVLDSESVDINALKSSQERFGEVLSGLSNGSDIMKLNGATIPNLKTKLNEVQSLWRTELITLNGVASDVDKKEKAIDGLNSIMIKMSEAVSLYNKSYSRFKQKSKLSSIVTRHINGNKHQVFAFSTVQ